MAIQQVNFTITTAQTSLITDYLGYQAVLTDEEGKETPNPETRKVFLYGKVKDYLRNCYLAQKAALADQSRVDALAEGKVELENLDVSE